MPRSVRISSILLAAVALLAASAPSSVLAHGDVHTRIQQTTGKLRVQPNDLALLWERAELYRAHADRDHALADYASIRALTPHDPWIDLAEADVYLESALAHAPETETAASEFARARTHALRFLDAMPDEHRGWELLARIETAAGDPIAGAAAWRRAQSLTDTPPPAYFLSEADALETAGESAAALAGLDRGIAALGNLPALVLRAVAVARAAGDPEDARARASQLPEAYAETPAGLALLGELSDDLDRPLEAAAYYTDALERLLDRRMTGDWNDSERALAARLERYLRDTTTLTREGTE